MAPTRKKPHSRSKPKKKPPDNTNANGNDAIISDPQHGGDSAVDQQLFAQGTHDELEGNQAPVQDAPSVPPSTKPHRKSGKTCETAILEDTIIPESDQEPSLQPRHRSIIKSHLNPRRTPTSRQPAPDKKKITNMSKIKAALQLSGKAKNP